VIFIYLCCISASLHTTNNAKASLGHKDKVKCQQVHRLLQNLQNLEGHSCWVLFLKRNIFYLCFQILMGIVQVKQLIFRLLPTLQTHVSDAFCKQKF
jgi:hypothetical protein